MVLDRPLAHRLMELEISDGHLTGKDEGNGLREKSDHNRQAAIKLQNASNPCLRQQMWMAAKLGRNSAKPVKQLHTAGLNKKETRHDAQQKQSQIFCSVHIHKHAPYSW